MRILLLFLWLPIITFCWKECDWTECKWFWQKSCDPSTDLQEHAGPIKVCTGLLWIRYLCCTNWKDESAPWSHVEYHKEESVLNLALLQ
ncbi:unnamed protein product [Caenorhabditis sp. 36 PRJEB53466]|nr:unnamed protein product [Caenorhabditis sp. 36 PRJEB53466]